MAGIIPIARSLRALAAVAGSQAAVARFARLSEGTLINWSRGLGLRDSKHREAEGARLEGWVVAVRDTATRELVAMRGSASHLEDYAKTELQRK